MLSNFHPICHNEDRFGSSDLNLGNGFPGDSVIKNPPANAGDAGNAGWIPGLGRSSGVGNSNPL